MKMLPLALNLALACAACSPTPDSAPASATPAASAPAASAPAASAPATAAPVDKVRGFRAHRFGDDFATFPRLLLVHQSTPDLATYARPKGQEDLQFGKVKLSGVTYTFYQRKLYGVTLLVTTPAALQQLSADAVARYGPPSQQFGDLPAWAGTRVQAAFGRYGLGPAENGQPDTTYLQLLDKPTLDKILADRQRAPDAPGSPPGETQ